MEEKWICTNCGFERNEQPERKNETCPNCKKGRFKFYRLCECGKWFNPNNYSQKYCSKECGYKYRKSGGKKGKHYPQLQRARIAVCPVCGKEFRAVHDWTKRVSVYCSKECWSKRGRKKYMKPNPPEYREWKRNVFKRDNYTCQRCGAKKNLEAHHVKEKINFPELKYDVENGVTLCHECHKKTDNYGYKAKKKAVLLNAD